MWLKCFESYARALKLEEGHMCDAMLSLLDDVAFRAYDLLGLGESDTQDYKLLCKALADRFAPVTGEPELLFQFGCRLQKQLESIDEFADALIDLVNRAYPTFDPTVRMKPSSRQVYCWCQGRLYSRRTVNNSAFYFGGHSKKGQ